MRRLGTRISAHRRLPRRRSPCRPAFPHRHARTRSIAVRFGFRGRGARPWQRRDIGTSVGSGHGSRRARMCRPFPPLSPRTCSGVQSGPASRSGVTLRFPGHSGSRNKSGVTAGGGDGLSHGRGTRAENPNRTPVDSFRASTPCGIAVRAGRGRGGGGTWMPGTSPGMTEKVSSTSRSSTSLCKRRSKGVIPRTDRRTSRSRGLRARRCCAPRRGSRRRARRACRHRRRRGRCAGLRGCSTSGRDGCSSRPG